MRLSQTQGNTAEHLYFSGTGSAYHPETGELLVYAPASTHNVVNKKQAEAYHNKAEFVGRQPDFTFTAMDNIQAVINVLTTAQCGYLLLLQCYVGYGDGRLQNADKTPMSTSNMMKALGLERKRQTFYDFLRKCVDNGIITKDSANNYYVNPAYHFRGVSQNRAVIRSYTTKVKEVYSEVKASDLGLMYRMLPYVHYGTNALCSNPLEQRPEDIRWFNGKELAAAIGVDEKTLCRRLPKMVFAGEYVIAKLTVGGVSGYFFNPNVFFRKNTKPDDTLIVMFNTKPKMKK